MKTAQRILILLLVVISHFAMNDTDVWFRAGFYLLVLALSIITVLEFWKNNKQFKIIVPEILLLIFILYLILNNSSNNFFFIIQNLLNYLILLSLYFVFSVLCKNDNVILKYISYGLFTSFSLEVAIGFGQLFGLFSNVGSKFVLGGLFENPGAFAGYLAITSPFLLAILFFIKNYFVLKIFSTLLYFFFFVQ